METNRTMRTKSGEWAGRKEEKSMLARWSDTALPAKEQWAVDKVW